MRNVPIMCITALFLVPLILLGQTSNASLGGTASDTTGALLPGVEVTARNVGTGITNTAITNETGTYHFPNLQTGTYQVSAALPSFRTQQRNNVVLGVSQQVRLNFVLEVGEVATTVEVLEAADAALSTTSASIGSVLPESQVRDLPLGSRNIMELLAGMAGTGATDGSVDGYFGGNRLAATNVTRDGMTVSTGRYDQGSLGTTYMSPDLVEEVRVTTGTVDAEAGRGSGQIQMVTRSGTNQFRGSAFWNNRNSALSAPNWFNNFNGVKGNFENRNQYGVRLGGPIIRNKTFFFVLIDNQRTIIKEDFVGTVLTDQARNGIFRFFPGAENRNAFENNPTVDRSGNPVRPSGATGDLRSIDLFSQDPFRTGYDPTGWIQNVLLARMPSPNDFTVGDGLNTAGIRFTRRINGLDTLLQDQVDQNNRDQINVRLDHNFSSAHKLSFVYSYENSKNESTSAGIENWPNGFNGANRKYPRIYNFSFTSTLASSMVNDFRAGYRIHDVQTWAPIYVGRKGHDNSTIEPKAQEALKLLPTSNGIPLAVIPQIFTQGFMSFSGNTSFGTTRGSYSPLWQIGDTLSWISGSHAFKIGFERRVDATRGFNDNNFTPAVQLGAGNVEAPINSLTIPGLVSANAADARNILYNLAGSIDHIRQGFDLRSAEPPLKFLGYQDGNLLKSRDWRAPEANVFFKDEWKATRNLTLNLGIAWTWYGVPYEANGLAARVVGGLNGLCGPTCGGLTRVEFVGRNSSNPDQQLFDDDWNNFAPSVGFSYSIPGGRSTVLRGGYGISYIGRQISSAMSSGGLDSIAGTLPGAFGGFGCCGQTYTRTGYWNLQDTGVPFTSQFQPLEPFPITAPRTLTMNMYEQKRVSPYVQNFNLSIQRELAANLILDVSYVGSKGSKLYGRLPLNDVKIRDNQFLEAFNVTRAGGSHPLFDRMLMGLNIPGAGRVNGTTMTGSEALRRYTSTRADIARGEVGTVANFLTTSTNVTGQAGGFVRNGGLAENFFVFNPQFVEVGIAGNPGNSTYHSMQLQLTKRTSYGLAGLVSYTFSKNLGISDSDHNLYGRDPNNFSLDKALLSFHRTHIVTGNGTYVLPFGANRALLGNAPPWLDRLVGQWQLGFITRWSSGSPLTLTSGGLSNIWQQSNNTPHILGEFPKGALTFFNDGALPAFFPGLTQGTDPGRAAVTSVNSLNAAFNNRAIFDAQGNALLINPAPGDVGSLGLRTVEGPSRFQLDMNLNKRVRLDETRELEFRADVTNVLNHPVFGNPTTDINSASFGRIRSAEDGRKITLGARFNF